EIERSRPQELDPSSEIAKPRQGGRRSRDKRNRIEREVVERHEALGVHAERYPLSGASRSQLRARHRHLCAWPQGMSARRRVQGAQERRPRQQRLSAAGEHPASRTKPFPAAAPPGNEPPLPAPPPLPPPPPPSP